MSKRHSFHRDDQGLAAGVKTATVIFVVGVIVLIADRTFMSPYDSVVPTIAAEPAAVTTTSEVSFAVPGALRIDAGAVPAHVEAF